MVDPELEVTLLPFCITAEGRLSLLVLELVHNLAVGDVAHLEVLFHDQPFAVTNAVLSTRHHRIASIVCLADIAVYSFPSFMTLALLALSW